jgi:peptidylprolyl isomerase
VQDNYVVQWGDADGEDKAKAKGLPGGLAIVSGAAYTADFNADASLAVSVATAGAVRAATVAAWQVDRSRLVRGDAYSDRPFLWRGWPIASEGEAAWPVHCYGMVGVGRDLPPDTGSGAEFYVVIGHAPRHLDRNIALVGRVIEGVEHLSSLPRGTAALGFYATAAERTSISAIRIGSEVPSLPRYQYLSTESASFARYADARANRRDAFFVQPAGGADVCNIPVPVRRVPPN